jgi:hypothetical protein
LPTYDYFCATNGLTLEARHRISETVTTWGELCARTAHALGDTPSETPVTKVFTTSNVVHSTSLGSGPDTIPACGMGACAGGSCQFQ